MIPGTRIAEAAALWSLFGLSACSGPAVREVDFAGLDAILRERRGGVTAVCFWARWSRRSVALLPSLAELRAEFEPRGVELLSVRLEDPPGGEGEDLSGERAERFAYPLGSLLLREDFAAVSRRYGFSDLPAVLIFDAAGRLRHAFDGVDPVSGARPEDVADAIESLL